MKGYENVFYFLSEIMCNVLLTIRQGSQIKKVKSVHFDFRDAQIFNLCTVNLHYRLGTVRSFLCF